MEHLIGPRPAPTQRTHATELAPQSTWHVGGVLASAGSALSGRQGDYRPPNTSSMYSQPAAASQLAVAPLPVANLKFNVDTRQNRRRSHRS